VAEDGGKGGELGVATGVCGSEVFDGGDHVDGHDDGQSRHVRAEGERRRSLQIVGYRYLRLRERAILEGRNGHLSSPFAVMFRRLILIEHSV